jgi:molybdopterin molybdotransferase
MSLGALNVRLRTIMRTPKEAISEILGRIEPITDTEAIPIKEAAGRILSEEVVSDVDLPPFEKSMMDGYAVRSEDTGDGAWSLRKLGESRAGEAFGGAVGPGECIAIYTGAEMPDGADAVVMVERTREDDAGLMHSEGGVPSFQNVAHKGEVLAEGRSVLSAGRRLDPVDLALLAAVGCDPVPVFRRPRVSILTTGDELVPAGTKPGPAQIREGNTVFLAAAAQAAGVELLEIGIVADSRELLEAAFERAFDAGDVLITTGGVSMGKYDLVGPCLEAIGTEPVLHKVAIKPGKPIWFGMRHKKPVFGLPGNPVSSLLGFEVFVRPALVRLSGGTVEDQAPRIAVGRWNGGSKSAAEREINLPVAVTVGADGVPLLTPVPWKGSADVAGLSSAAGFGIIPAGGSVANGELIQWRPFACGSIGGW